MMSEKTSRLLDDYERLKFESEHLRLENLKLKEYHASTQLTSVGCSTQAVVLDAEPVQILSHFNSKESLGGDRKSSLSVADLTQYDSVGALLEEKNHQLESKLQ